MYPKTIGVLLLCSATLMADFSYTTTSRVTGGAAAAMSRMMGGLSKTARSVTEGMTQTVAIQGNRKVTYSDKHASIIDLDKEAFIEINFEKKSYSIMTFAEMQEAMKRGMEKMKDRKGEQDGKPSDVEADFKVDIKETGQKKAINGIQTKEVVMLLQFIGKDKKTQQSGAMDMLNSIWVADPSAVPGHKQEEEFNKKMALKMAGTFMGAGGNPQAVMAGMDPKMMNAMKKAAEEGQKLQGVHVMQISKMGTGLDPATASQISNPNDTPQGPTGGQIAGDAAAGAAEREALGRLGRLGGIGGLGGFGRRKKNKEAEESKPAESAPANGGNAQAQGLMMEMVMEMSNFSTAPIDASRFEVPAGFKQEERRMR